MAVTGAAVAAAWLGAAYFLLRKNAGKGRNEHDSHATDKDEAKELFSLGSSHQAKGNYAAAGDAYRRALCLYERSLGGEHRFSLACKSAVAMSMHWQGNPADALPLLTNVYEISRRTMGPGCKETVTHMLNLALVLTSVGQLDDAYTLYEEGIPLLQNLLGQNHPASLKILNNFSQLATASGRFAEARVMLEHVLAAQRISLGSCDPDALMTMHNLALVLHRVGQRDAAVALTRECLEGRQRVLGPQHPLTLNAQATLEDMQVQGTKGGLEDLRSNSI